MVLYFDFIFYRYFFQNINLKIFTHIYIYKNYFFQIT